MKKLAVMFCVLLGMIAVMVCASVRKEAALGVCLFAVVVWMLKKRKNNKMMDVAKENKEI